MATLELPGAPFASRLAALEETVARLTREPRIKAFLSLAAADEARAAAELAAERRAAELREQTAPERAATIRQWASERLHVGPGCETTAVVHDDYLRWCRRNRVAENLRASESELVAEALATPGISQVQATPQGYMGSATYKEPHLSGCRLVAPGATRADEQAADEAVVEESASIDRQRESDREDFRVQQQLEAERAQAWAARRQRELAASKH